MQDASGEVFELSEDTVAVMIFGQHFSDFKGLDPPFGDFCWCDYVEVFVS